jgi:hypothetical protein
MVRFKNRYLLVDYTNMPFTEPVTERALVKLLKDTA